MFASAAPSFWSTRKTLLNNHKDANEEESLDHSMISVKSDEFTDLILTGILEREDWWSENVPLTYKEDFDAIYEEYVGKSQDNLAEIQEF